MDVVTFCMDLIYLHTACFSNAFLLLWAVFIYVLIKVDVCIQHAVLSSLFSFTTAKYKICVVQVTS